MSIVSVKGDLDTEDLSAILMFIAKKITAEQLPLDKLPTAKGWLAIRKGAVARAKAPFILFY